MKNKNQTKNKKTKNIKSLIEVKRLLKDQNIVSGYYEDCAHKNFTQKSSFCPCPWDNRVLNGSNRDTSYGCYYNCSKDDDKIIENKEIYLKAIDNLISTLQSNTDTKRFIFKEGILDNNSKKQLVLWEEKKYREENELNLIGCPPEFISDLKLLHDSGCLDLGKDFLFFEDKIIYKYVDTYDFSEFDVIMTPQSIWFTMLPDKSMKSVKIDIGTGCLVRRTIDLNSKNKEQLLNFWNKWLKFKKDNPNLYNSDTSSFFENDDIEEEFFNYFSSDLECELCLFSDHCDRLFCLKNLE